MNNLRLSHAPDHIVLFFARAHMLQLLGDLLLPDASNNKVKLMILPLLRDFEAAGKLSWGSTVLTSLHRALCRATKSNVDGVCGPLVLLQLWTWERIPLIRPERLAPRQQPPFVVGDGDQQLPASPYGSRWDVGFKLEKFVWQPYADIITSLPDYCLTGREFGKQCRLSYVLMWYNCIIQAVFGQHQSIPADCDTIRELHSVDRLGRQNTDWVQHHKQFVDKWADHHARVVSEPPIDGPMDY